MIDYGSVLPRLESALAFSLLQAVWWGALLGLAAAVVLAAMARCSAAARHAVGLAFLIAMAVMPGRYFIGLLTAAAPDALGSGGASGGGAALALPALLVSPATPLPCDWLAGLWAAGVLAMLIRLAGGAWLIGALARVPAAPLSPAWQACAETLRQALGITRPVAIRVLHGIAQPFAARVLRPIIWLPAALLTQLAPAQVKALLAHELAHLRRLDWLWNGLQCTIEALLFFHPAVWLLGRRVRQEREHACDDLAAAVCGDKVVVAEALAALAALFGQRPLPRLVLAAGGGALRHRVERLVGAPSSLGLRGSLTAGAVALLLAGGLLLAQSSVTAQPAQSAAAADPWWTILGDSIRIRATEDGHVHDFHTWRDLRGARHETYRIDGALHPVDDAVRRWAAEHHAEPSAPAEPELPPCLP